MTIKPSNRRPIRPVLVFTANVAVVCIASVGNTTQLVRVRPPGWTGESVAAYRRSWLTGFAYAVHQRLDAAEHSAEQESVAAGQHADGISTARVLIDRNARVDRAVTDAYPNLGTSRRRSLSGSGGHDGYTARQRADLGTRRVAPTAANSPANNPPTPSRPNEPRPADRGRSEWAHQPQGGRTSPP